jgi:hypothetical protein
LRVADQLPSQPEEGLLEVVVGLGGDIVVLQILLAVEGNGLSLDFSLLDIDFVAGEDDWDVFADTDKVTCTNPLVIQSANHVTCTTYDASWGRSCR